MVRTRLVGVILAGIAALVVCAGLGCKKEAPALEYCRAKCRQIGAEYRAKCDLSEGACDEMKRKGDENCNKTCDLAFPSK